MTKINHHGIFRVVVLGAITWGHMALPFAKQAFSQNTQITGDPTFNTQVTGAGPAITIEGGIPEGFNLFHRFSAFTIEDDDVVTFVSDPAIIENIFAQVLGPISLINGEIQALDAQNFFLINPNGIVFGPQATLNVGGNFIATTADTVVFENDDRFGSTSQAIDLGLLVNVDPVALQFAAAALQPVPMSPVSISIEGGLDFSGEVNESLFLIGGGNFSDGILLDSANINAPDKRVGLFSFQGAATFNLDLLNPGSILDIPAEKTAIEVLVGGALADISLINDAQVNVTDTGRGSIIVFSNNLLLDGSSDLLAGFSDASSSDLTSSEAGEIDIVSTGLIRLTEGSSIENTVNFVDDGITGVSGDINIRGVSFEAIGTNAANVSSGLYNRIEQNATGVSGSIDLRFASSFILRDGAVVTASSNGTGNPGNISLTADVIELIGKSDFIPLSATTGFRQSSALFSAITDIGASNASGLIEVSARQLRLTEGGALISDTLGQGNASDITVTVTEKITLDGEGPDSDFRGSGIYSRVNAGAVGDGGTITISAGELEVTNGATINAATSGIGNAGNINVFNTGQTTVDGQGEIVDETGLVSPSSIIADTTGTDSGRGGNLTFQNIGRLFVQNGGQVSALTEGTGPAGTLTISGVAELIRVSGIGSEISFSSLSREEDGGDAGNLRINPPRLEVLAGGQVAARTVGEGAAGRITVNATDSVVVDGLGSGILFDTSGSGDAQGIEINTPELLVRNNGRITVEGRRSGSPGNIAIAADVIYMNNRGEISASTRSETGGNIAPLRIGSLLFMTDGSEISASALAGGSGGNIQIIAPNASIISRSIFEDNDIIAIAAGVGTGGSATAEAALVEGFVETRGGDSPFSDFSASSALGTDGITRIEADFEEFEELPLAFSEARIAQVCRLERRAEQSAFVVTGRGGVPATPGEVLNIGEPEVGLVTIEDEAATVGAVAGTGTAGTVPPTPGEIVEPQGWRYNEAGQLVLVAAVPQSAELPPIALLDCRS